MGSPLVRFGAISTQEIATAEACLGAAFRALLCSGLFLGLGWIAASVLVLVFQSLPRSSPRRPRPAVASKPLPDREPPRKAAPPPRPPSKRELIEALKKEWEESLRACDGLPSAETLKGEVNFKYRKRLQEILHGN